MQKFTPRQAHTMAKTLREVIHAFGLSKDQLAALAGVFALTGVFLFWKKVIGNA